jgi:hypothetical protein
MAFSKFMSKKEIARMLGICPRTLQNYLNRRYFAELEQLGYERNLKLLSPRILNFLAEKIDLQQE